MHIAALSYGFGEGVVGAFYNIMPQVAHRLIAAHEKGDLVTARKEQYRMNEVIRLNTKYSKVFFNIISLFHQQYNRHETDK
jgi:dihydrodipicolinate synthase/N-acetylneuraminate lyase